MKNNKGFTLIELLAVIVILGLLMAIAIPAVTRYITESRKKTLVSSIDSFVRAASIAVNEGDFDALSDGNRLYYIQVSNDKNNSCIFLEKGGTNPFGNWRQAYVVVHYNAEKFGYDFYFTFIDDAGYGMALTKSDAIRPKGRQIDNPSPISEANITKQTSAIMTPGGEAEPILNNGEEILASNIDFINVSGSCVKPIPPIDKYYHLVHKRDGTVWTTSPIISNNKPTSTIKEVLGASVSKFVSVYYYPGAECDTSSTNRVKITSDTTVAEQKTSGCYYVTHVCLVADTEVEVYDKKKKKRKKKKLIDVTPDDLILAWDFDEGKEVFTKPLWIMEPKKSDSFVLLKFSDGSTLKVVNNHRIFNADKGMFTQVMDDEQTPIGTKTFSSNNKYITLVSKERVYEDVVYCNMITERHMNFFGNGILTSWRINNIYKVKDMKYVKDDRKIRSKEDIPEIPEEWFEGVRAAESPDSIEQIISDYNYCKNIEKK